MNLVFSEDLEAEFQRQKAEIDRLLLAYECHLKKILTESLGRHQHAILVAADKHAERSLKDKEDEIARLSRRIAEMEDRMSRLQDEKFSWQTKAMNEEATMFSLQSQLQEAMEMANAKAEKAAKTSAKTQAYDVQSAYMDSPRNQSVPVCRACHERPMSIVLLPCRHLSLCTFCSSTIYFCPICSSTRSSVIEVLI